MERCVSSLEWKREGVIDGDSDDADENGDLSWPRKWDCEAKIARCGWGSRNDSGSWFQRQGAEYRKERLVIFLFFKEEDVRGLEMVTTD